MRNFVYTLVAAAALFLFTNSAQAGVLLEPYIGYNLSGTFEFNNADSDVDGLGYGARVAYTMMGFMVGGDFSLRNLKDEDSDKADATDLGIFVGYEFPILLRVWAAYLLDSKLAIDGVNDDLEGSGIKLGVGYTALPLVSINLEMIQNDFDEVAGIKIDSKMTTYMLSVSVPFGF